MVGCTFYLVHTRVYPISDKTKELGKGFLCHPTKRMCLYRKEKHCLYNLNRTNRTFTFANKNSKQFSLSWTGATDYKPCFAPIKTLFQNTTLCLRIIQYSQKRLLHCFRPIGTLFLFRLSSLIISMYVK